MKGLLYKSKQGWMVKYTTYKTIPGIKGVIGSHSRIPESNHIPLHPDDKIYIDGLWGQSNNDEVKIIDFEIVIDHDYPLSSDVFGYAKLINEEKIPKYSKQKKYTNITENNIKRMYTEDEVIKLMSMATRWDTFKEEDVEYNMDMNEFFKYLLNK
jgi:hypothetical protein